MARDLAALVAAAEEALRQGRTDVAQAVREEALAIAPEHPQLLNALAVQLLNVGDAAEAARLFLRAAHADPRAGGLWFNHATAARAAGDTAGERASLLTALACDPAALGINVRLAELHEREGEVAAAQERWGAVVSIAERMDDVPAAIQSHLDHARAFVAAQNAKFGAHIDDVLATMRDAVPPRERRRIDAAVDFALGRRPIFINQCSGLHIPFLPADEFFDRALFPWLSELEAGTEAAAAEARALIEGGTEKLTPYVDMPAGVGINVWTKLNRSPDWSAMHLWRHGERDKAACARCPQTAALIERLPLARLPHRMPTVFFSVLAPHTHIPAHTGVTNARAVVHLPLIVPEGCRLRVGGETRAWRVGEAMMFDDTIEHEAWNNSDEYRVVLILDAWNPHLSLTERDLIQRFYEASEASDIAPGMGERLQLG